MAPEPPDRADPSAAARARRGEIVREHAERPHSSLPDRSLKLHLLVHEIVEKQLADDDPPEVARTLRRLMASGLTHHQAVHAIGSVVACEALAMLREGRELDREAYVLKLRSLSFEQAWEVALGRS
ncbi:MAG: DUF1841 family protein [Deltaproteobacteria bacterium]|nr:DUF1841 family protein [Deltaproteobacteria bacterium]